MTTAPHEMRTDTTPATAYGPGVSSVLSGAIAILLCFAFAARAAADDEPRFHRTTPRGSFERDGVTLVVGVPGGRAWGIESDLRPIPAGGGLRVSLMAYLTRAAVEPAATLDGFTPEQRLFLGWGQVWCENVRPERARMLAQTNPHSPGRTRVNGVLSNMPEFQKAFSCKAGAPMVRQSACRVW